MEYYQILNSLREDYVKAMLDSNGASIESRLDLLGERITSLEAITNALNATQGGRAPAATSEMGLELQSLHDLILSVDKVAKDRIGSIMVQIGALDQRLTELEVKPLPNIPPEPEHKHKGDGPFCRDMLRDYPCTLTEPHVIHYYSDDEIIIEWERKEEYEKG